MNGPTGARGPRGAIGCRGTTGCIGYEPEDWINECFNKHQLVITQSIKTFNATHYLLYCFNTKQTHDLWKRNKLLLYDGIEISYNGKDFLTKISSIYDTLVYKWVTLYLCYKDHPDLFTNIWPHYFNRQLWV